MCDYEFLVELRYENSSSVRKYYFNNSGNAQTFYNIKEDELYERFNNYDYSNSVSITSVKLFQNKQELLSVDMDTSERYLKQLGYSID